MPSSKDISATEKLLELIRNQDTAAKSRPEPASSSGRWQSLKQHFLPARTKRFLGVELLRDNLHLVHTEYSKAGWRILQASSINLPDELSPDTPEFQNLLQTHLQSMDPTKSASIWIALPASKGEIWHMRIPKVKKGISNVVYWSARKEKRFDTQESFFDYRIKEEVDEGGVKKLLTEVCLAPVNEVGKFQKTVEDIGYKLHGITLPAFALDNIFQNTWEKLEEESYAVLYVGEDKSYIDLYGQRTNLLSRMIRIGQDSLLDTFSMEYSKQGSEDLESASLEGSPSELLQENHQPDRARARQLLKQLHLESSEQEADSESSSQQANPLDMIYPALERLIRQIDRTIDHSVKALSNPAPEKIYICGKIAYLHGIEDFFSQQLGMSAEVLDVLNPASHQVSEEISRLDPEERYSLVSTAGLAMPWSNTVNFLHTALDRERENAAMRKTNLVATGCALAFVVVAGYWAWTGHKLDQVKEDNLVLQEQLNEHNPRLTQEMLQELVTEQQNFQQGIKDRAHRLRLIAMIGEISRITPEGFRLLNMRLELGSKSESSDKQQRLIVEGFIRGQEDTFETRMTSYLKNLRRSPIFKKASIQRSSKGSLEQEGQVYRFMLNIEPEQV